MKRIPLVLLVFFALSCNPDKPVGPSDISGTKTAAVPPKTSKLSIAVSATNRYLVDAQGNPILLSGDAAWSLIAQLSTPDAEYYLQQRSAYGFNFSLVNLIEHQYATNAPANFYKDKPFTGRPFATPNEAYFAHADQVIALAANYGIFIALDATYIGYSFNSEGWGNEMKQATNAELLSWGQYCGTRYKDFPNIIWVIGGDWDPTQVKTKLQSFIDGLKATDPNHIITAHNQPESQAITPWPGQLTLNGFYTYSSSLYDQATSAYNYSPTLPFIQLESKYENERSSTAVQLRSQAYWTILCGGTGDIFGNYPTWRFSFGGGNWKPQMSSAGSTSMKYMAALFRSRNWHKIIPDFTHQVMISGYGTGANYATTAKTSDGSSIISYLPNKKTVTVNTSSLAGDSTDCWWYSPSTGTSTYIGRSAKGSRSFTSPSTTDWVFVADAVSFGFGTPGVGTPQPPVPPPSGTFSALPDTLPFIGGTTVLSWTSQYTTSVSIDHGIGPVDSVGAIQAHVNSTTLFTLSLSGVGGTKQYQAMVVVVPPQPPSGSLTAQPDTLPPGGGTTILTWTAVNDTSVVINHGIGKVDSAGSLGVQLDSTTTFTMTISGFGGAKQFQKTIVVLPSPPPNGAFTAIPDTLPVGGGLTMLFWSSGNATSASIDHGIGAVDTVGSTEVTISATTTFHLTLTGKGGTTQLLRTVFVPLPPPPAGTFTAIPDTLPVGGGLTILSWSSTNDTSAVIDHGIGAVDLAGSMQINVTETTTFTLTLTGGGGTGQASHTVFVPLPPPPTGTFTASPDTLPVGGGSTTLSWSSRDATTATIDHGIGAVAPSGSMPVSVTAITTYLLTLTGAGGTRQISHAVYVPVPPPPTGTFTATPDTLPVGGGTTTLSWSSSDATTATIDHGIGTVAASGSLPVSVSTTTTYLLTLTGAGGTKQISHTVFVPLPPPPTGTFKATPSSLPAGGGLVTLSWTSQNASSVSINPGIGAVNLNDSLQINVVATTTYTLHVQNVTGTADYPITVTVALPQPSAEVLYDDAYRNSWSTIRSWSVTLTPGNTTPVERGTASLKAVMSAWGSLQLSTGTWSAFGQHDNTHYSGLDFWVNAGTKAFVLYVSAMSDSPSYSTNLKSYVTISLPANTWTHVTIPMSSLATSPFVAVNFSSYSVAATFYLDDVQLLLNP